MEEETDASSCKSDDLSEDERFDKRSYEDIGAALAGLHKNFCGLCHKAPLNCACALNVLKMSMEAPHLEKDHANDCGVCKDGQDGFMIGCESCDGWFHGACVDVSMDESSNIRVYYCARCREKYSHLKLQYYTELTTVSSAQDCLKKNSSVLKKPIAKISLNNSIRPVGRPRKHHHPKKNNRFNFMDRVDRTYKHYERKSAPEKPEARPKMVRSRSENSLGQDGSGDLRVAKSDVVPALSFRKQTKSSAGSMERRHVDDDLRVAKSDAVPALSFRKQTKSSAGSMERRHFDDDLRVAKSDAVPALSFRKQTKSSAGSMERRHFDDNSQHRKMNIARKTRPVKVGGMKPQKFPLSMTMMPPFCTMKGDFSADEAEEEPVNFEPGSQLFSGRPLLEFPALDDPLFQAPEIKQFLHKASHGHPKVLEEITAHFYDLKLQEEVMFVLQTQMNKPALQPESSKE